MAIFAHRIHLPLKKIHEMEKTSQERDWFWLKGWENDPLKKTKKKRRFTKKSVEEIAHEH